MTRIHEMQDVHHSLIILIVILHCLIKKKELQNNRVAEDEKELQNNRVLTYEGCFVFH